MWDLMKHLWHDEVGSSQSTEMALVTGVTIGALVVSMQSFGEAVNNRFSDVEIGDDSMAQLEQKIEEERIAKELSEKERLEQFRERRRVQLERKKQRDESLAEQQSAASEGD
jgi:hypothetical protein